jgi:hypothetical protein
MFGDGRRKCLSAFPRLAGTLLTLAFVDTAWRAALVAADDKGDAALDGQIRAFCGDCHAMPSPSTFPKSAWREEVNKGFNFYAESKRTDLEVPPLLKVVEWFASRAPTTIEIPVLSGQRPSGKLRFRQQALFSAAKVNKTNAGVAFVAAGPAGRVRDEAQTAGPGTKEVLFCDMRWGGLGLVTPGRPEEAPRILAQLANPCHAHACDLDGNGRGDLVVADLGSFRPRDHDQGRVIWLKQHQNGVFEAHTLLEGLGRVADVESADFDADGDLDLIVAVFGLKKTGKILLLENAADKTSPPEFREHVLDRRNGTIHVPVADLNGDGHLDFVALVSQEHESIEAFINVGQGQFERRRIHAAGEPAYGSTGIELVDFDEDGDFDVLYTNGDAFDSFYLRPFHGVRWLENRGRFPFVEHELALMPGAHRALAVDLDNDGDLDVAACALLPVRLGGSQPRPDFDAVMWLEQTSPGRFERHGIIKGRGHYPTLDAADLDADGDLDLVVGAFRDKADEPCLEVLWNEGTGGKRQGRSARRPNSLRRRREASSAAPVDALGQRCPRFAPLKGEVSTSFTRQRREAASSRVPPPLANWRLGKSSQR